MNHAKSFIIKQEYIGKVMKCITKETQYTLSSLPFDPLHLSLVCNFSSNEELLEFDKRIASYAKKTY